MQNKFVSLIAAVFVLCAAAAGASWAQAPVAPPQPDNGFTERAERLLRAQAEESLPEKTAWAERIKLGDPHKYIQPIIAAKLHVRPGDPEALDAYRWIKTVDIQKIEGPRDRGMYHFSAIYKTRLFFQFGEQFPPDLRAWFHENEAGHISLFRAGGTENHGMMHRTSGYLWAERFQKGGSGDPKTDDLAYFRKFLRDECKKLYTIGMGEWDSSTYVAFTVTGWLNVYDFAADPRMKQIARAALDWYAAAYALKQLRGVHAGPEARGFARHPGDAISDVLAWLWFGQAPGYPTPDLSPKNGAVRYSIAAALSTYRPDPITVRIARKEVPLPFSVRASKPAYYGYERGNEFQEVLFCDRGLFMGTLYDPTPGDQIVGQIWPQTTQFKLAVDTGKDVAVFGMGNSFHRHFPVEGRSPADQFHQEKGAAVYICSVPAVKTERPSPPYSLLAIPAGVAPPTREGDWYVWEIGDAFVAARPLGEDTRWTDLTEWLARTNPQEKKPASEFAPDYRWLRTDGALCGWVVDTAVRNPKEYPNRAAFVRALKTRTRLDLQRFASDRTVTYRSLRGDTLMLRHTGGLGGKPEAETNGKKLVWSDWPVYDSPCVQLPLRSGVLTLSDGKERRVIDFSGDAPVWR
jgi:hypothetical protein